MLRINVATRKVVVPTAPNPDGLDRWLLARPGVLTEREMATAIDSAVERADTAERAWVETYGPKLAAAVRTPDGCVAPEAADPSWPLLLAGYSVTTRADLDGSCVVLFEPSPMQHRRRFKGWVTEEGLLDEAHWPEGP